MLDSVVTDFTNCRATNDQLLSDLDSVMAADQASASDERFLELRATIVSTKSAMDTLTGTASQLREKLQGIKPESATSDEMKQIQNEVKELRELASSTIAGGDS